MADITGISDSKLDITIPARFSIYVGSVSLQLEPNMVQGVHFLSDLLQDRPFVALHCVYPIFHEGVV